MISLCCWWTGCSSILIISVVFIATRCFALHRITAPWHWAPPSSDLAQLHPWNQMNSLTSTFSAGPKVWTRCSCSILKVWTLYQHSSVKAQRPRVVVLLWAALAARVNVTTTAPGTELIFQQVAGTTSTSLSPMWDSSLKWTQAIAVIWTFSKLAALQLLRALSSGELLTLCHHRRMLVALACLRPTHQRDFTMFPSPALSPNVPDWSTFPIKEICSPSSLDTPS